MRQGALLFSLPLLLGAPRGDGHPVLLLPGFLADEKSLFALKFFLTRKGYDVRTWGLGRNVGFQSKHVKALPQKINATRSALVIVGLNDVLTGFLPEVLKIETFNYTIPRYPSAGWPSPTIGMGCGTATYPTFTAA